jgi:hypothetical protein
MNAIAHLAFDLFQEMPVVREYDNLIALGRQLLNDSDCRLLPVPVEARHRIIEDDNLCPKIRV